jgi:7-cyano-7-deazaguanine synthase
MKVGLLLSGGMDSTSIAWWKRPQVAITIDYGQLCAQAEIEAAGAVCSALGIEHRVCSIDCRALGSGDMAGTAADSRAPASDWWPFRNQLLITIAAMTSIKLGVSNLMIGTVKSDGTHKDGTLDFVESIASTIKMQEGSITLEAPAILLTTAELIRQSGVPDEILAWSHSCHRANIPCGSCRGCNKYFDVLKEIGSGMAGSR